MAEPGCDVRALVLNYRGAEMTAQVVCDLLAMDDVRVSVVVLDFIDFTKIVAEMDPNVIVGELNDIFTSFDRISEQFGCERIKTMGDAYLAISGMPDPNPDHARAVATCATRFVKYLERRNQGSQHKWLCRVGIATGSVVGSVVGVQKYVYDIFGPAVNLASRLQDLTRVFGVRSDYWNDHGAQLLQKVNSRLVFKLRGEAFVGVVSSALSFALPLVQQYRTEVLGWTPELRGTVASELLRLLPSVRAWVGAGGEGALCVSLSEVRSACAEVRPTPHSRSPAAAGPSSSPLPWSERVGTAGSCRPCSREGRPAQAVSRIRTGRSRGPRIMPTLQRVSPSNSKSGKRATNSWIAIFSSSRARLEPRQRWIPRPKAA